MQQLCLSKLLLFFNFPLYLQSVPIHSANVVKSYTKACRRVLTSTLLYLIGSGSSCDLGSVTYKLYLQLQHLHIESGRQIYWQVLS
jgi:hypothetical protein